MLAKNVVSCDASKRLVRVIGYVLLHESESNVVAASGEMWNLALGVHDLSAWLKTMGCWYYTDVGW